MNIWKAVLIQYSGYLLWLLITLKMCLRVNGNDYPHTNPEWLAAVAMITLSYFLLQIGFLHAKLNRIERKVDGKETQG